MEIVLACAATFVIAFTAGALLMGALCRHTRDRITRGGLEAAAHRRPQDALERIHRETSTR